MYIYIYIIYLCMYDVTYNSKSMMDQPGKKVANTPAHGQLNRENIYSPVPVRA